MNGGRSTGCMRPETAAGVAEELDVAADCAAAAPPPPLFAWPGSGGRSPYSDMMLAAVGLCDVGYGCEADVWGDRSQSESRRECWLWRVRASA